MNKYLIKWRNIDVGSKHQFYVDAENTTDADTQATAKLANDGQYLFAEIVHIERVVHPEQPGHHECPSCGIIHNPRQTPKNMESWYCPTCGSFTQAADWCSWVHINTKTQDNARVVIFKDAGVYMLQLEHRNRFDGWTPDPDQVNYSPITTTQGVVHLTKTLLEGSQE